MLHEKKWWNDTETLQVKIRAKFLIHVVFIALSSQILITLVKLSVAWLIESWLRAVSHVKRKQFEVKRFLVEIFQGFQFYSTLKNDHTVACLQRHWSPTTRHRWYVWLLTCCFNRNWRNVTSQVARTWLIAVFQKEDRTLWRTLWTLRKCKCSL